MEMGQCQYIIEHESHRFKLPMATQCGKIRLQIFPGVGPELVTVCCGTQQLRWIWIQGRILRNNPLPSTGGGGSNLRRPRRLLTGPPSNFCRGVHEGSCRWGRSGHPGLGEKVRAGSQLVAGLNPSRGTLGIKKSPSLGRQIRILARSRSLPTSRGDRLNRHEAQRSPRCATGRDLIMVQTWIHY